MKKILNKKVLGVLLAVMMLFSLSAPAFATGTTATVKIYMPDYYFNYAANDYEGDYVFTNHDGYTYAGIRADVFTEEDVDVYSYTCAAVDYSTITDWLVSIPSEITDWHPLYNYSGTYIPTVFDVIYKSVVNGKGEATSIYPDTTYPFVYGFESPAYAQSGGTYIRADGIFVRQISSTEEDCFETDYSTYWVGYGWMVYAVPASAANTFDPLAPDTTYLIDSYANNVSAQDGYTYYVIFEYAENDL